MFYKIGFWVLFAIVILFVWLFINANPMQNEGSLSWTDFYSDNPKLTVKFLEKNLGIKVAKTMKSALGTDYNVLKAKGQLWPFAGIMETPKFPNGQKVNPHSVVYLTVKNYEATEKKMLADGAIVVMPSMKINGMKLGIYKIPGGLEITIVQYGVK